MYTLLCMFVFLISLVTKHGLALRHKIRRCTVEVDRGCSITDKGAFQCSGGLLLLIFYIYIYIPPLLPSLFFHILLDGNKGKTLNRGQDRCSESKMCTMNKRRNYSDGYRLLKLQCWHCRHLHITLSSCPHPVCAPPPYFGLALLSFWNQPFRHSGWKTPRQPSVLLRSQENAKWSKLWQTVESKKIKH